jgi:hypothetical protein
VTKSTRGGSKSIGRLGGEPGNSQLTALERLTGLGAELGEITFALIAAVEERSWVELARRYEGVHRSTAKAWVIAALAEIR